MNELEEINRLKFESTSSTKRGNSIDTFLATAFQRAEESLNHNLDQHKKFETILLNLLKKDTLNLQASEIQFINEAYKEVCNNDDKWIEYFKMLKQLFTDAKGHLNQDNFDETLLTTVSQLVESIQHSHENLKELIHDLNVKHEMENDSEIDEFLK